MPASNFLPFAHTLADAAGAVIRPYFGGAHEVELKADDSPVSPADREAEAAIRALIEQHYPDHAIFGEEYGSSVIPAQARISVRAGANGDRDSRLRGDDGEKYCWVIDPIDGTRAFLAGKKEWGTLIALCANGIPILGILDQPVTGERWVGMQGMASTYSVIASDQRERGNPAISQKLDCHVAGAPRNDKKTLSTASISTTSSRYFTPPQAAAFVRLAEQCGEVIEDGDCYAYGLLAHGERDLVVDCGLKPYDILALAPIITGAGGTLTGWDGAPVALTHYANVLAAGNAILHKEALDILNQSF